MNGVLSIDKPKGITSHDVVDHIRNRLKTNKVGHLGTLDPLATGVLPITIGKATRLARFIPSSPKEYTGRIRFGWATTTSDREGEVLKTQSSVDHLKEADITELMRGMTGQLNQVPPTYSAKKISGVPAHRLARQGIPISLLPASVQVQKFDLIAMDLPFIQFYIRCSSGTYVRSLARDLGETIGTGAHLDSLRRIKSGPFELCSSITLDQVSASNLIPPEQLLLNLGQIHVNETLEDDVHHGRPVECQEVGPNVRIFNKKLQLIAIATVEKGWAYPKVVLI